MGCVRPQFDSGHPDQVNFKSLNSQKLSELIKAGGVGVLPTDTLYGIVGQALNKAAVERIYKVKGRSPEKPFIILISSFDDLEKFSIELDAKTEEVLKKSWPGQVSVILPCPDKGFEYLHRGTDSLAFRFPNYPELQKLINETGPLAAPSANPEGEVPSVTVRDAKKYFGNQVDYYVDVGPLEGKASTLIRIKNGDTEVLRQGEVKV